MKSIRKALVLTGIMLFSLLCPGLQSADAGPFIKINKQSWLLINYEMQLYGQWRDTGSGPDNDKDTYDAFFRRNRLILLGQATKKAGFFLSIENKGDRRIGNLEVSDTANRSFLVLDAFFKANLADEFNMRLGLTKHPMVREHNEGCFYPLSADRSLFVYTAIPKVSRDIGAIIWGNLINKRIQYRLAVMKGNDNGDDPKSSFRYTGRLHLTLLDPESSIVYRGSYLGKKKVLTFGIGYEFEPDALYSDLAGLINEKNYMAFTFDGFFEYPTPAGTFTLSGAYLRIDFDDAYLGTDPDTRSIGLNGEKNGWYAKAGYMLPKKIGPGKLQFFGRHEKWNFANLQDIYNQEIAWTAGGINYYIRGQKLRITVEYALTDFNEETPDINDLNTVTTMLQFLF